MLLEQWAPRDGRVAGWYTGPTGRRPTWPRWLAVSRQPSPPSFPGPARACSSAWGHEDPEREAALLAEMLAEDLVDWPARGLLVIDDYEYVAESAASERS